jgi:uncharacterized protein related to proFAR isomerase
VLVIPVIDVRHGVVVRAVAGDRTNYKPIVSPLFKGCDPRAAVAGLMALHPFHVIYLADLDAIEGRASNHATISVLANQHPSLEFWLDQSARTAWAVGELLKFPNAAAVIGSETGIAPAEIRAIAALYGERIVLSLDHRATGFIGEPDVLADQTCWPDRVIAMTLAQVGTAKGPDLATLRAMKQRHPAGHVYAAGGIANPADLAAARQAGASGALVASALHAQTITAGDL